MLLGQAWRGARRRSARHRRRSTLGRPSLLPACACGLGYDGHVLLARRRRRATLKSAHLGVLDRVDMPVGRRLSASHRLTPSLGWRLTRRCRVLRRQHYKRDACSIRLVHVRAPSTCERRIGFLVERPSSMVVVRIALSPCRCSCRPCEVAAAARRRAPRMHSRLDRARKLDFQAGKRTEVWFFIVRRVAPRQPSHLTTNPFVPCTHLRPGRAVLVSKPSFHGQLQECKSSLAHTRRPRTRPRFANARPR